MGEMIFDVVRGSIHSLLNPELTASWEKGLTYVAEGTVSEEEYMKKLNHFVQSIPMRSKGRIISIYCAECLTRLQNIM